MSKKTLILSSLCGLFLAGLAVYRNAARFESGSSETVERNTAPGTFQNGSAAVVPADAGAIPVIEQKEPDSAKEEAAPRQTVSDSPETRLAAMKDLKLPHRADLQWREPVREPAFEAFRQWTERMDRDGAAGKQGLKLAQQRRREMAELIVKDPRRALELAVPESVRERLPADVAALLEQRVDARGDLMAVATTLDNDRGCMITRTVTLQDGRAFDAYTYGRRAAIPTRDNIAIHGVALDGKLALSDLPGRVLEPSEVAERLAAGVTMEECPERPGAAHPTGTGDGVVIAFGDTRMTRCCDETDAVAALFYAEGDELSGATAALAADLDGVIPLSAWTEGQKTLLVIRVDFPDYQGDAVSEATLEQLVADMNTFYSDMSSGKASFAPVGQGSAVTVTVRMPQDSSYYTSLGRVLNDARPAAAAAGYNYLDYSFDVVVTGPKPSIPGVGGGALLGARGTWLCNSQWNIKVCSHEVGHNFGLLHSAAWDTDDGSVIGPGDEWEYGFVFDNMGVGYFNTFKMHFCACHKQYLGWIPAEDVVKITTDGTTVTRIRAMDKVQADGNPRALAVDRPGGGTDDYWIEHRQLYGANYGMQDGVLVYWANVNGGRDKPLLLDMMPTTITKEDAVLPIFSTFSDTAAGVCITPVARGTDPDGVNWIDVGVSRGSVAGNRPPVVSLSSSTPNPALNAGVTFTATASDPDGDTLAYFWDWGDGTTTPNNSATAGKSWSTEGIKIVRCTVSDMKGLTATALLAVQVDTSSTFFIEGMVRTPQGVPVQGAVVRATGPAVVTDSTDASGHYVISNLQAGGYTLTAEKTGRTIRPENFTNSVTVGPSLQSMNFTTLQLFDVDPIVTANGTERTAYTGTIAGYASDPAGGPLTFSKVSGPSWLTVAADGTLSGTPGSGDLGLNTFTVQVSGTSGADTAALNISVDELPHPPGLVVDGSAGFTALSSNLNPARSESVNTGTERTWAWDAANPLYNGSAAGTCIFGGVSITAASNLTVSGSAVSIDAGGNKLTASVNNNTTEGGGPSQVRALYLWDWTDFLVRGYAKFDNTANSWFSITAATTFSMGSSGGSRYVIRDGGTCYLSNIQALDGDSSAFVSGDTAGLQWASFDPAEFASFTEDVAGLGLPSLGTFENRTFDNVTGVGFIGNTYRGSFSRFEVADLEVSLAKSPCALVVDVSAGFTALTSNLNPARSESVSTEQERTRAWDAVNPLYNGSAAGTRIFGGVSITAASNLVTTGVSVSIDAGSNELLANVNNNLTSGGGPSRVRALYLWDSADFLVPGYTAFDNTANSSFKITAGTTFDMGATGGSRYVIRDGGTYYLSSVKALDTTGNGYTASMSGATAGLQWASFDPSEFASFTDDVAGLGLPSLGTFGTRTFDNVTGVGFIGNTYRGSFSRFEVADLEVSLASVARSGFDVWADSYGGIALIGSETNDYDGDLYNNLLEYALNGNPTNRADGGGTAPVLDYTGSGLTYVHVQRNNDDSLIYSLETTTDLINGSWTNAGYSAVATNTAAVGNYDTVTYSIPATVRQLFIRLRIRK